MISGYSAKHRVSELSVRNNALLLQELHSPQFPPDRFVHRSNFLREAHLVRLDHRPRLSLRLNLDLSDPQARAPRRLNANPCIGRYTRSLRLGLIIFGIDTDTRLKVDLGIVRSEVRERNAYGFEHVLDEGKASVINSVGAVGGS